MAYCANAHSVVGKSFSVSSPHPSPIRRHQFHPFRLRPAAPKLTKFSLSVCMAQFVANKLKVPNNNGNAAADSFPAAHLDASPPHNNFSEMTSSLADPDFLLAKALESDKEQRKVILPPRICTLRMFGKSGEGVIKTDPETMSAFLRSLAASIEISSKIRDWEILSGRLAMIVFASAVLLEALTGNSVFHKMDTQRLGGIAIACMMAVFGAAGFALAWRAKTRVADNMSRLASKGCENLVNSLIDNIVDGLFFDEE